MTKICLIAAFPPSIGPLSEYSYHIARELQRHKNVELTILADELEEDELGTAANSRPVHSSCSNDLPGVTVIRCWKFGSLGTPLRVLKMIRQLKPDVVWFNLVFSSFGSPASPVAAFAGLSLPAMTRAAGFYTHITLHHIIEHVDFATAGVPRERLYRKGTDLATRSLLKAHSVSVLLSDYRRTLMEKYAAENIIVGTHGTFANLSSPPDLTKRGNPEHRILAFGNWGTYKRLDKLIEAFPAVLKKIPNARLIIAGGNHPAAAGYWESIRDAQPAGLPIEFLGYVQEKDVSKIFATSSVLVMPYDSSTGSSGPAHQACEFGVPIVCADIPDFRCMAADDDMAILFYKRGDSDELADKLVTVLQSPELQRQMSDYNYEAGVQMTMANVSRNYLRWFELHKFKRSMEGQGAFARLKNRWTNALSSGTGKTADRWQPSAAFIPKVSVSDLTRSQNL
jgi:glycosyltransferase involved in cell wall biosynthesis